MERQKAKFGVHFAFSDNYEKADREKVVVENKLNVKKLVTSAEGCVLGLPYIIAYTLALLTRGIQLKYFGTSPLSPKCIKKEVQI